MPAASNLITPVLLVIPVLNEEKQLEVTVRSIISVSRQWKDIKREVISRCYNYLVRMTLGIPVRDLQCGFKAIKSSTVKSLCPLVCDDGWFFDTELLMRAYNAGYRIQEIPLVWLEGKTSKVKLFKAAIENIRGIQRLQYGASMRGGRSGRMTSAAEQFRARLKSELDSESQPSHGLA